MVLTVVTIAAHPTPIRLAGEQLSNLESRLAHTASDIWYAGKSLELSLRDAGGQVTLLSNFLTPGVRSKQQVKSI